LGTPDIIDIGSFLVIHSLIRTAKTLFVRKSFNQHIIYFGHFNLISLKITPSCQTLSNAEAMSKKIVHIRLPLLSVSMAFCVKNKKLSFV
jgi:hypothetical protein